MQFESSIEEPGRKSSFSTTMLLTFCYLALILIGLANLYSAGEHAFYTQVRFALSGLFFFLFVGWVLPLRFFYSITYVFYAVIVGSLIFVLLVGHSAGGATRWISLFGIRFQPSEIAKLAVVFFTARFFSDRKSKYSYTILELWPVISSTLLVFALIFKQPDFGTAGMCVILVAIQLAFIRINITSRAILFIGMTGIIASISGWLVFLRPYQKLRILNLLNPELDPSGSGYNSLQSLVAIGSGQITGKGFLQGTQNQLSFLPARHTDFIFSVFAEEHGFVGSMVVLLLFAVVIVKSLDIAKASKDSFSSLLCIGTSALIFSEFMINVAMVLGVFPVVGMPLPFFSKGGSSLVSLCAVAGLQVAINRDNLKRY